MQPASLLTAQSRKIDIPAPLNPDADVERGVLPLAPMTDAAEPPSYKEIDHSHDGRGAPISQSGEIKPIPLSSLGKASGYINVFPNPLAIAYDSALNVTTLPIQQSD